MFKSRVRLKESAGVPESRSKGPDLSSVAMPSWVQIPPPAPISVIHAFVAWDILPMRKTTTFCKPLQWTMVYGVTVGEPVLGASRDNHSVAILLVAIMVGSLFVGAASPYSELKELPTRSNSSTVSYDLYFASAQVILRMVELPLSDPTVVAKMRNRHLVLMSSFPPIDCLLIWYSVVPPMAVNMMSKFCYS